MDFMSSYIVMKVLISVIFLLIQRPPYDYDSDYLASHEAVSFHKVLQGDPVDVYNKYFGDDDDKLLRKITLKTSKDELWRSHFYYILIFNFKLAIMW